MKRVKWPMRLAAGALVSLTLLGVALAAGQQGTQADPLVTLSYLTTKLTPELMAQVDTKLSAGEQALTDRLGAAITTYTAQIDEKLAASAGGPAAKAAAFAVVDLAAGQKLHAGIGCEIMLRVGAATCSTANSPGLIDMTDGGSLDHGQALLKNHLYMATIEGRGVVAKNAVKLLVRGDYTIG
ncbi:MAG: hypothetical protein RRY65_00310 [Pseudoflavonifractor sp.]